VTGYRPQSDDTDPKVDRMIFEHLRTLTPLQRAERITEACRAAEQCTIAGLRLRYPDADEAELRFRAGALRLGEELVLRAYGWDMAEKGR